MMDDLAVDFDEAYARRALDMANLNALRIALLQATGDQELAEMKVVTESFWLGTYDVAAIAPEHASAIKDKAIAFLKSNARDKCPLPNDAELRRLMDLFTGGKVNDFIFNYGKEELSFDEFPRGVAWRNEPSAAVKAAFKVIIVGAGVSGIVTAIQLDRLGIPYTIIERNAGVGGTWWTNDYPDARVDIPSHHYQLSFMKNYPWKHWFATQEELKKYIQTIAEQYGILPHIRFNTELTSAKWDQAKKKWVVALEATDGVATMAEANVVISAAGLFNEPNLPDIPGIESFGGKMFHTTQWDHTYDYRGKRVGLIGVGSTGAQLMPRVAQDAAQLTVFQRSPQWVAKMDGYRDQIPEEVQWMFDRIPHYWNWYCYSVFHTMFADDGALSAIDPEWQKAGGLINRRNDNLRKNITGYIATELAHDPELAKKCTPAFAPFAKRLVVDNGWFDALKRPNVSLVTEGIERITANGILTKDGNHHDHDLLVLGAGFKTERYLWPTQYEGQGGLTLEGAWEKDGARAYLGIALPKFPNLFIIYGPNMQARAGGLFAWLEIWSRYAVSAIAQMLEDGKSTIEVRQDIYDAYNASLDEADERCIYREIKSYYLNKQGRQGVNNPFPPSDFYSWVRTPNFTDYIFD